MATAILQARMSSSRLPGKVLRPLLGQPMILRQIERLRRCQRLERIVVATSEDPSDDILVETIAGAGVEVVRGPLEDVLGRFIQVRDVYGNTYTYGHLASLSTQHIVAKQRPEAEAKAAASHAGHAHDEDPAPTSAATSACQCAGCATMSASSALLPAGSTTSGWSREVSRSAATRSSSCRSSASIGAAECP
jgi:hypothetical protein